MAEGTQHVRYTWLVGEIFLSRDDLITWLSKQEALALRGGDSRAADVYAAIRKTMENTGR